MRLTLPFVALCVAPSAIGFILPDNFKDLANGKIDPESTRYKDYNHLLNLPDKHEEHDHGLANHKHKTHKHKHKHLHPHEHIHHNYHKHPIKPCHILTTERTCKDFHKLTDEVEKVIHIVQTKDCGNDEHCWHEVVKYMYELEYSLDLYDKHIDKTTLRKCFNCDQEAIIVECYYDYADTLIRLLKVLKHKSKYLEGEVDRPVLTAINSLRVANYALTYEFGRRINCKETLKDVMEKQGANDGSTKGSVQQAFEKFIYTPLITGEDFKNKGSYESSESRHEKKYKDEDEDEEEEDKYKKGKVHKHHHEHFHGHKHGHGHGHDHKHGHLHGHLHGHKHDYEHKHDEHKHDEHKHDEHKHDYEHDREHDDEPHYNHLNVRGYRDTAFYDKNTYSQGPSNDYYFEEPFRGYLSNCPVQPQRQEDRQLEWQKQQPFPLDRDVMFAQPVSYSNSYPERYPGYPESCPERYPEKDDAPKWYSPERSPYNHYHGNRRGD
ncbi:uncharacterized protein FTOL_03787 [Fusarium torulosum]|uniref:Uncharacterized protein n=1 Tax=Fusarium torulosum TaxID=33205 RepID=A0AAE8SG37_9HYPO|nr:uncharacterized protein FTOL_03787 [Fusarium torulosum]